VDKSSGLMFLN